MYRQSIGMRVAACREKPRAENTTARRAALRLDPDGGYHLRADGSRVVVSV